MKEYLPKLTLIFAQSFDGQVDTFIKFIGKILLIVGLFMVVWAGLQIHDGRTREGISALFGAFIMSMASIIVHYLFGLGGW